MTVAELITKLQALPNHNLRVVVRGYEAGYNDITELEELKLKLNVYNNVYYGDHESPWETSDPYDEIAIHLSA